jgi:hypothetical protein
MFHVKHFCPIEAQNLTRPDTESSPDLVRSIDFLVQMGWAAATPRWQSLLREVGSDVSSALSHSFAWVPSQSGSVFKCLQPQKKLLPVSSAVHTTGTISVVLCEPSQKGCFLDWPQAHHQYVFPASTSTD